MARLRRFLGRVGSRIEALLWPAAPLVPPLHLRWSYFRTLRRDGIASFAAGLAQELLSRNLEPHSRVLDVGSGLGPLAVGLVPYLTVGSYDGLDVHAEAVAWCKSAITPRHPRFRFRHADLFNTAYNPSGTQRASEYRFPYEDGSFDFAFLGSLCTHLLEPELSHYVREVARVLRPGGTCVVSFYLLNPDSLGGIEAGTSFFSFVHDARTAGSRIVDPNNPELAVAHREELVRSLFRAADLVLAEPIRRGRWWAGAAHQQDVVAAVKSSPVLAAQPG